MQYGEPVFQGKSNSSSEVVSFPWINIYRYNVKIMNTLHGFSAKPAQYKKKLAASFK